MVFYRDLNDTSPKTKPDIFEADAIVQGVVSLIFTRPGEVLFDLEYGVPLDSYLFELMDDVAALDLFGDITNAIGTYESRVTLDLSRSNVTADPDRNQFNIDLFFEIEGFESEGFFRVQEAIIG